MTTICCNILADEVEEPPLARAVDFLREIQIIHKSV
jgi:hypothetical protein